MKYSYCWQCSMEAVTSLVSSSSFDERLQWAQVAFSKLSRSECGKFTDEVEGIQNQLMEKESLSTEEKDALAMAIYEFHAKMCAHNARIYLEN